MTLQDTRPALAALLDHLDCHPGIAGLVGSIDVDAQADSVRVGVFVGDYDHTHHLGALIAWAATVADSGSEVAISALESGRVHLKLLGKLADGTAVDVRTIVHNAYADLIKANVDAKQGATFPLGLLKRLTSSTDAEAVARG